MRGMNILNKQGFLTKEDRKEKLVHSCNTFTFESVIDLTEPIKVTAFGTSTKQSMQSYSKDLAAFMIWWTNMVLVDLNGFSGTSHLKFEFNGFELV